MKPFALGTRGRVIIGGTALLLSLSACSPPTALSSKSTQQVKAPSTAQASQITTGCWANSLRNCLVDRTGQPINTDVLAGKEYILLYFSAHWCGPCRQFTPQLVQFYNTHKFGNTFELVFVSADRSREEMREYMNSTAMPWPALAFEQRGKLPIERYSKTRDIPCLVMLDQAGHVLSDGSPDQSLVVERVETHTTSPTYTFSRTCCGRLVLSRKPGQTTVTTTAKPANLSAGPAKVLEDLRQVLFYHEQIAQENILVGTPEQKKAIQILMENPAQIDQQRLAAAYTISGIVAGSAGRRAMINGATFAVGDQLAGLLSIVEISMNAVTLQMGSRTFTLSM